MDAENPLLRAVRAFEEASLEDAEFALKLIGGIMDRKRERFVQTLDDPVSVPSIPDRAADALRKAAKPMTTSALATATGASVSSIATGIGREIRDKGDASRFMRIRNGVFALREWRKTDQGDGAVRRGLGRRASVGAANRKNP